MCNSNDAKRSERSCDTLACTRNHHRRNYSTCTLPCMGFHTMPCGPGMILLLIKHPYCSQQRRVEILGTLDQLSLATSYITFRNTAIAHVPDVSCRHIMLTLLYCDSLSIVFGKLSWGTSETSLIEQVHVITLADELTVTPMLAAPLHVILLSTH
jgi:hypothetical protein